MRKKTINSKYWVILLSLVATAISIYFSVIYFFDLKFFSNYDAIARLNIARRVIDSLTPGLGQLGGVWLPFPQILYVPLVTNDFLWRSGIAGMIVSGPLFVITSILVYRITKEITSSFVAGTVAWLVFISNINVLSFQTAAMSEIFFIFSTTAIVYYLLKWVKTSHNLPLLLAAVFCVLVTLTRYEGYFVLIAATLSVLFITIYKYKGNQKKIEGLGIIFITLASFGFIIWTIYSLLIFKDPIYWLNVYSGRKDVIEVNQLQLEQAIAERGEKEIDFISSAGRYTWSILMMNGVLTSSLFIILLFVMGYSIYRTYIREKTINTNHVVLFIIAFSMYAFFIIGYAFGLIPPIQAPTASIQTLLSKQSNNSSYSNLRYGLLFIPFISIILGLYFQKNVIFKWVIGTAIAVQVITTVTTPYFLIFQVHKVWNFKMPHQLAWFKENYDGGFILISSARHEPFMMHAGIDYKNFIYEGTQNYWNTSIESPAIYARWIIFQRGLRGDAVATVFSDENRIEKNYEIVYNKGDLVIFKRSD